MIRLRSLVVILALNVWTPVQAAEFSLHPLPKTVPSLSFTDQNGQQVGLDAFKGKVVVLDYWASWCAPCRVEFPRLDGLQERLGDKGLVVVAVSLDRGGRVAVDRFYDEMHVKHLAKFVDPTSASARVLGLRGMPTTLIIDRQGFEVARIEGMAAWDGPDIGNILEGLLAGG